MKTTGEKTILSYFDKYFYKIAGIVFIILAKWDAQHGYIIGLRLRQLHFVDE
jgi:hypothetical protein